jgi:hypothetical protein
MEAVEGGDVAVPGVVVGPDAEPGPLVCTLDVDGETFAVRRGRGGGTDYDWISGPNDGYGFGSSAGVGLTEEDHRRSISQFLGMIDSATGYIAEE